ncbi:MAG: class I SAM-dependent methyltransferase [Methanomicrobiales archaeon]|nr:class I SAM-dependent methyltransferase [Methanomicrobiales archaeon]
MARRFPVDDPERRRWQDPERILTLAGIGEGMVFVDVGCGEGYFALPAARRVGPRGRVCAVDISPESIGRLRSRAVEEGLGNITPRTGRAEDTVFCEGCADIVFFGIDLHDFGDPVAVLRNAERMVAPGGRVADLDWKDEPMDLGPPPGIRFSAVKAGRLMESAGLRILSVQEAGPYHYLILAGKRQAAQR